MINQKFDERDRKAVIRRVEKSLGVELSRVGKRRKWLRDQSGKSYWVFGGYGEWHGIPSEMMDAEALNPTDGFMVVAARSHSAMKIYIGNLNEVVSNREKLYRARKTTGDYQFTYKKHGAIIVIEQSPNSLLSELTAFDYTEENRKSDVKLNEVLGLLESMSEEERNAFIESMDYTT